MERGCQGLRRLRQRNGGRLLLGIEDGQQEPPTTQRIPANLPDTVRRKLGERIVNVGVLPRIVTAQNVLHTTVRRNEHLARLSARERTRTLEWTDVETLQPWLKRKRIEPHRLAALVLEDLQRYPKSAIGDIHQRIGSEIRRTQVKQTLDKLIKRGHVRFEGEKRWRRYWAVK